MTVTFLVMILICFLFSANGRNPAFCWSRWQVSLDFSAFSSFIGGNVPSGEAAFRWLTASSYSSISALCAARNAPLSSAERNCRYSALWDRYLEIIYSDGVTVVLRQTLGIWIITRIVLTLPVKEYRPVFGFKRVREGAREAVRRVFSHWRCVLGTPQIALS